jgi:hypothetical protein
MQLEYNLTKDDLVQFAFHVGWASPAKRTFRIIYYVKPIGLFIAATFILYAITKPKYLTSFFTIMGIASILGGLVSAYLGIHYYKKKLEKIISDPHNSSFMERTELVLSDSGIIITTNSVEFSCTWDAIKKKEETVHYFYLYLNSLQGIIIPKRVLSIDQKNELIDLLSRNLSLKAEFNELYTA